MGLFGLSTRKEVELEKRLAVAQAQLSTRSSSLAQPDEYLVNALRSVGLWGASSDAGVVVDERSTIGLAAFARGLNLIGDGMASMKLKHYRKDGADRNEIPDNLIERPNPWQTQFQWVKTMSVYQAYKGNAYARIVRDANYRVIMIVPISPRYVKPVPYEGDLFYRIELTGHPKVVHHTDMIHWKGLCIENIYEGIGCIEWHAQTLGISIAAEKSLARFNKAGAKKFVLTGETGRTITDPAKESLKLDIEKVLNNQSNSMMIPNGIKLDYLTVSPEEAQYLNTLKNGAVEVARMLNIPAFMLDAGDSSRGASLASSEQDSINFYQLTLHPKTTDFQQELKYKLISDPNEYYKFNFDSMLRADAKTRAEVQKIRKGMGWSDNEIRNLEDLNGYEGGDRRYADLNQIPKDREDAYYDAKETSMTKSKNPTGDNNNTES
jgi:HK97 family phage portal protein